MKVDNDLMSIDPFIVIEQILAASKLSEDERDIIKQVSEHLSRIIAHFDNNDKTIDALAAVYRYGIIIGSYVKLRDPETLTEIDRHRGKVGGHASGEVRKVRPWHEKAKKLANEFISKLTKRAKYAKIASHVINKWDEPQNPLPTTSRQIEAYISSLDQNGELIWPEGL